MPLNKTWVTHCQYITMLNQGLASISSDSFTRAYQIMRRNVMNTLYTMGNGGSAAIADHFVCDYSKGINTDGGIKPGSCGRAVSLCSNGPLIMAISNDIGYDSVFEQQLEYLQDDQAVALAISSSGNSPNILKGLSKAREIGYETIALVGFDGGAVLRDNMADAIIHVDVNNYGVVEDIHHIVMHSLTQQIRADLAQDKVLKL